MNSNAGDQLLRAYAVLTSLRDGLPETYWLGERWVRQYNGAIATIERAMGISLSEFAMPTNELERLIASQSDDHVTYEAELSCPRAALLQRINAVLIYFTGLQGGEPSRIGFHSNG